MIPARLSSSSSPRPWWYAISAKHFLYFFLRCTSSALHWVISPLILPSNMWYLKTGDVSMHSHAHASRIDWELWHSGHQLCLWSWNEGKAFFKLFKSSSSLFFMLHLLEPLILFPIRWWMRVISIDLGSFHAGEIHGRVIGGELGARGQRGFRTSAARAADTAPSRRNVWIRMPDCLHSRCHVEK